MSKTLYLGLYGGTFGAFILFLILTIVLAVLTNNSGMEETLSPIFTVVTLLLSISIFAWLIVHVIFYFLIVYKMWDAIQDGYTEITSGKAIGFMFIPFFNIYWIFKVFAGYPAEYNAYVIRNNINVPQLSSGIFVALPIMVILTSFYIGILGLPFVMMALINKVCDAINALQNAPRSLSNNYLYNPPPPPRQF